MDNQLLLVEWVDSAQLVSNWHYLSDPLTMEIIQCVSVGWKIQESDSALVLAPNIGDYESGNGAQGTGFIRIPKAAITRTSLLEEVTSSCL